MSQRDFGDSRYKVPLLELGVLECCEFWDKNEGGKTCSNLKFFIRLKISLSVDIEK